MAISFHSGNYARQFNSVYQVTLDMSGWDKTNIQIESPMAGSIFVYGGNDDGRAPQMRDGDATLAANLTPIQVTNLATGTAVSSISAAGNYSATINAQFLRLQANPAGAGSAVYGILFNHSKI